MFFMDLRGEEKGMLIKVLKSEKKVERGEYRGVFRGVYVVVIDRFFFF